MVGSVMPVCSQEFSVGHGFQTPKAWLLYEEPLPRAPVYHAFQSWNTLVMLSVEHQRHRGASGAPTIALIYVWLNYFNIPQQDTSQLDTKTWIYHGIFVSSFGSRLPGYASYNTARQSKVQISFGPASACPQTTTCSACLYFAWTEQPSLGCSWGPQPKVCGE